MPNYLALGLVLIILGCSGSSGTGTGISDDIVTLKLASYSATYVSDFTACFLRVRLKTAGESTNADVTIDEDNIDISSLGRRTIPAEGANLKNIAVDLNTYTRVEIDLEDDCGSSTLGALSITNTHGQFSTTSRVTLIFTGTFEFTQTGQILRLDIDNMITELKDALSDADVPTKAQLSTGTF